MLFSLFIYFFYINIFFYFLLIFWFILGLLKIKSPVTVPLASPIKKDVSVIVCVKNEENVIGNLLDDLKSQVYDEDIEFIIVDDNSNDKTAEIISHYIDIDNRFKYICSKGGDDSLSFKKKALDAGIKAAQFKYLLFTDAGCRLEKQWIQSIMKKYLPGINYVIGLSFIDKAKKFITRFQKVDLFILMISTISSVKLNYPLASTGQNLSYKKDVFLSMNGFSKISNLMMGDDSIFMQMCLKQRNIKVDISDNPNSFVQSKMIFKWRELLLQRIRWAGDGIIMWNYNKLFYIAMLFTFTTNLFYFIMPFIFYSSLFYLLFFYVIKFLFEFIFYCIGSIKINKRINILNFIIWFFLQIPYIVFVGFLAPFSRRLGWK
tara:strand:- start:254 stop:1378 length:1125 start_codon:yes stop_codon:yes gene_type:complete